MQEYIKGSDESASSVSSTKGLSDLVNRNEELEKLFKDAAVFCPAGYKHELEWL